MRFYKHRDNYNIVTELACTSFARRCCHYFKEGAVYSSIDATLSANFVYLDSDKKISVQDALDEYYIRKAQKVVEKTMDSLAKQKANDGEQGVLAI